MMIAAKIGNALKDKGISQKGICQEIKKSLSLKFLHGYQVIGTLQLIRLRRSHWHLIYHCWIPKYNPFTHFLLVFFYPRQEMCQIQRFPLVRNGHVA